MARIPRGEQQVNAASETHPLVECGGPGRYFGGAQFLGRRNPRACWRGPVGGDLAQHVERVELRQVNAF
jgi:hypothetical protein